MYRYVYILRASQNILAILQIVVTNKACPLSSLHASSDSSLDFHVILVTENILKIVIILY